MFLEMIGLQNEYGQPRYFLFCVSDGEAHLVWWVLVSGVLLRQTRTEIVDGDFALKVSLGHGFSGDVEEAGH